MHIKLQRFIHELEHNTGFTPEDAAEIMAHQSFIQADFKGLEDFNHCPYKSYGRRLLYTNDVFSVLLVSWTPGDVTAIHNHGETEWGSVQFFGQTTHRIYTIHEEELVLQHDDDFQEGSIISLCGKLIHLMGNHHTKPFVTLHVYGAEKQNARPGNNARVFMPESSKIVTTTGAAYLNPDPSEILEERPLAAINLQTRADYLQLVRPYYARTNNKPIIDTIDQLI